MINRLCDCEGGKQVKIYQIAAGRNAMLNLMNMGIVIGNVIEVGKASKFHGPVIVKYNHTEVAIGYGLAEKIIVEKVDYGIHPDRSA